MMIWSSLQCSTRLELKQASYLGIVNNDEEMQFICVFCSTEFCSNQLMEEDRAVGEESALHVCSNNSEGSLVRQFLTLFPFTLRHESSFLCIIGA